MIYEVDRDFQRKLDEFNAAQQPRVVDIYAVWDPRIDRWTIWALPVDHSSHPLHRKHITKKLCKPFPDGSGREGVRLFVLAEYNARMEDIGFMPLDDRLFDMLRLADTFSSKDHYEKTFEEPEARKALAQQKAVRDIAYGARSYWFGLDNLIVSKSTDIPSGGDWRWRNR